MMTNSAPAPTKPKTFGDYEHLLRQKVEQLTYLPASLSVAVKFIELGKDPDAGPVEYDRTISADAALGSKILALANSSWYGVRNEVKKVVQAITLLGLANIRMLATSYCMAGFHNHLKIPKKDVKWYWQAALCKGVAAKVFAQATGANCADEAFLAGLFQDIALPLIHSVAKDPLVSILEDPNVDVLAQIAAEREAFGVDHCEVGRWLATKLELPDAYTDAIAFHHDPECVAKFIASDTLANAIQVAAMFPHVPDRWHTADADQLDVFLAEHAQDVFQNRENFLEQVQKEFETLYGFFEPDQALGWKLADLLADACEEVADSTTRMTAEVHDLLGEAAKTGMFVQNLVTEHERVVDKSRLDPLTEILNRSGFEEQAAKLLHAASRHAIPFAVIYLDVDKFKQFNDVHGHHFGDFVLRTLCGRIRQRVRKTDVFGRLGGDEYAIILNDIQEERARTIIEEIMCSVKDEPFVKGKVAQEVTISVGVVFVPGQSMPYDLATLLHQADSLMYAIKRTGPGRMKAKYWQNTTEPEPV